MKKIFAGSILLIGIGTLLVWFLKPEQPYQPIVEAPHPEVDSLFTLMDQALRTRQYREGANLARQALEISRRDYRYGEVNSLIAIGFVLSHEAKYDSSIIVLEKARELVSKYRLDPEQRHRAGSYLAENYQAVGKIDLALDVLKESIKYFRQHENPLRLCATYNSLGLLYQSQGMYDKAEEIYQKGLEIARTIPDDRYYERSFTGNLGILYAILGELDKATPLIETSLRMGKAIGDPIAQGIDHRYLGDIQFVRGNFREALNHFLEDGRLMDKAGENHGLIRAYRNIAKVYDALNELDNAEFYYRKAIEVVDTKLGRKYKQFPQAYLRYASHKIRQGDYDEAQQLLNKAIAGYSSLNMPDELAACYLEQTELDYHRGEFDRGLKSARTAFEILKRIGVGDYDLASAHLWFGRVFQALDYSDSSFFHYEKAIHLSANMATSDVSWQAHHALAGLFLERDELPVAARHSQKAIAAIERLRHYTISPEASSRFLADKVQVYERYFDTLFRQYQQKPSDKILNDLFALSEKTRGRTLLENLNSGMESIFSKLRQSSALQDLEEQIVSVNQLLRTELTKPKQKQRRVLTKSWRKKLASLQRRFDLKTTEFATAHPELSTMLTLNRTASRQRIQEHMPKNTALLSYYASEDAFYAFVIDAKEVHLIKLPISSSDLREKIKRLRQPIQDLKERKIDFLRLRFDAELSHDLYNKLIAPLEGFVGGHSHLIIIPSAALHYLPFELLVLGKKRAASKKALAFSAYAQYRYLLERYTVSYLPSATLLPLLQGKKAGQPRQTLLAFGDPILAKTESEPGRPGRAFLPAGLRNRLLTPLPGATLEVRQIADMFDSKDVVAFTEARASESAYKRAAARFRFIHFATHGFADQRNPNFSALLLNPGNEQEDGLLYAYEIYAIPLNAELVSMSACETALGEYREGEGLVSLVQAFFAAGSRSVLASLWSVEDAAYPLMVSFYANVQNGMPKAEALRQAKLRFMACSFHRDQQAEYADTHPFLWAPFVFYGVQ